MKEYDYYYFDFDGTLVNTWKSLIIPFQKSFAVAGVKLSENDVLECTHMALIQSCEKYGIKEVETIYKISEILKKEMGKDEEIRKIDIFPETKKVLSFLKEHGKRIAVVSGNSVAHITHVMSVLKLEEYFDFYVGGDSTKLPKPYAEPLEKAMELSSFPSKEKCMYVGDSLQDPECAKNAGIDGYLIDRRNEYKEYSWTRIESLDELIKY